MALHLDPLGYLGNQVRNAIGLAGFQASLCKCWQNCRALPCRACLSAFLCLFFAGSGKHGSLGEVEAFRKSVRHCRGA